MARMMGESARALRDKYVGTVGAIGTDIERRASGAYFSPDNITMSESTSDTEA
jgi:hypothetical protein